MITLQNVHKQFGPKVLFQGVNFHLKPGEKVGLVGENGMGKTTLFRVILGLEPVEAGQVTVRKGAQVALLGQELESGPGSLLERVVLGDPHFRSVKEDM
ncbi:MAG: ATP-binding cassette domain-containing protein, partial [Nitrospinaceae bacterium]|nr:ABC-F family ATP-binding cassette domain-containing protein [Nitrospinaceae bacterium]NIR55197.1 ABC-F family ATP-binding cassette domain-containing protein [Nitrospinaceae bacterium]NIS83876.1 ABC-F family ATP-binding cassette domain-containing protein [Nitrospinaceae bacterium]NIT80675.1 ABC-F family ATP-binding cassette domain-containing protein [Nitrospinaceae bacterium]NIU42995.1 ABC-F family ATP-binding cassette domain-containing protein [Nitrospinaceae bacterium]